MGIFGLPLAATVNNVAIYLLGVLIACVAGFISTWILNFEGTLKEILNLIQRRKFYGK